MSESERRLLDEIMKKHTEPPKPMPEPPKPMPPSNPDEKKSDNQPAKKW